ncbi:uncharacterized protein BX664DRAFT_321619 [Halteromyces radiatus]|uniref:uncharacterized protein n=1 Tax=Halteromyces radiatus TaxID=101107 RepID=UPI0022208AD9|nr:uncharacterized protein BX664DRAFT_321619 [Halteromyces radiatus]KAI8099569.1 hypothetical protein BX664DRAFT_321619 [Halteromyces radiatus]
MLYNCKILSIDQLLFITCDICTSKIIPVGPTRSTVQQRQQAAIGPPGQLQQQLQLERKQQPYQDDMNYYCNRCLTHPPKRYQFSLRMTVFCPNQDHPLELAMYDANASLLFGCTASDYIQMVREDKSLDEQLEDYLTEATWDIKLKTKKKKSPTNIIETMTPIQIDGPTESIIPFLQNRNTHSSTLRLDTSLSKFF